ncbi:MAG: UU173 family protein [Mycoplasmoidaceae bacterium]
MKTSKYINKYDYINFYTKQKSMWFFNNTEIKAGLDLALKKLRINLNEVDEVDDEINYETDEIEVDSYEYFLLMKEELGDIDKNNPLIVEGNIIDEKSKAHIKEVYQIDLVHDFDQLRKFKSMEELAIETKKLLLTNEKIIIFQPVFISEHLITKPDALIKINNKIEIVETKGTTSIKVIHLLDLFFQKKVLERQDYLNNIQFEFKLCLVEYCRLNKNEISFIITHYCNPSKNPKALDLKKIENILREDLIARDQKIIELRQMLKVGEFFNGNDYDIVYPLNITEILNNNWASFDVRMDNVHHSSKRSLNRFEHQFKAVINEFDHVIKKLLTHKAKMNQEDYPSEFIPTPVEKGFFKVSEFFPILRDIYFHQGYEIFSYSGKVMAQDEKVLQDYHPGDDLEKYLKGNPQAKGIFEQAYFSKKQLWIDQEKANRMINYLKDNKLYFDFESINTAIRNADHALPFNQIVSQCSLIEWKKDQKIDDLKCENLIIDPKFIDVLWFKKIIDHLYKGPNYSYIVYNIAFEKKRISEIDFFINEEAYSKKCKIIIDNLYDLADFFDPNKRIILLKELHGFYSIKKVLPMIEKYQPQFLQQTKSRNYQELEIGNGLVCQEKTILRFFNLIDDQAWIKMENDLMLYCENDVRAMIAVEFFIKYIIKNKKLD